MMKKFPAFELVFQFYIEIQGSQPKIWRRVQAPVDFTFGQLHQIIQASFDWEGHHLHLFSLRVLMDYGLDVVQFEAISDDYEPVQEGSLNENEQPLEKHLSIGTNFEYHYDFGDDWLHEILVEGILVKAKKQKYPVCISGENHAPFEDIGGIYGYEHAVDVLGNPSHEEYKDLKNWLKECIGTAKANKFDPKAFDPKKVKFDL